jgi:hypothetical protein
MKNYINAIYVQGKEVHIIEMFDEYAVIQEVESKKIYYIGYSDIDLDVSMGYNINNECKSNIISLREWMKTNYIYLKTQAKVDTWQKKRKNQKNKKN